MTSRQPSKLLPELIARLEPGRRLQVLDVGPAMPDTVQFFSEYRCKLHFLDIFAELPLASGDDAPPPTDQFRDMLVFGTEPRFDICLFWDVFNYLDGNAVTAFLDTLLPFLHPGTRGHGFAVHNPRTATGGQAYAIADESHFSARPRVSEPGHYSPHSQAALKDMLYCFDVDRSMLLGDGRLEYRLKIRKSTR
ncbi:MAG: hypothetical protein AAGI11_21275 [Pseudomonadota bacterium]